MVLIHKRLSMKYEGHCFLTLLFSLLSSGKQDFAIYRPMHLYGDLGCVILGIVALFIKLPRLRGKLNKVRLFPES